MPNDMLHEQTAWIESRTIVRLVIGSIVVILVGLAIYLNVPQSIWHVMTRQP